jgi:hypothetical protein
MWICRKKKFINESSSQLKVFGESREAFLLKAVAVLEE